MRKYPYIPDAGIKEVTSLGLEKENYKDRFEIWKNHGRKGGYNLVDLNQKKKDRIVKNSIKDIVEARLLADQIDGTYQKMVEGLGMVQTDKGWYRPMDPQDVLDIKWSEYCEKYQTDHLYFANSDQSVVMTVSEGDGTNLEAKDEEEGYVDYWYVEQYDKEGRECGGGFLYLTDPIVVTDPKIRNVIDLLSDSKDLLDNVDMDQFSLISVSDGEDIMEEYEKRASERIRQIRSGLITDTSDPLVQDDKEM